VLPIRPADYRNSKPFHALGRVNNCFQFAVKQIIRECDLNRRLGTFCLAATMTGFACLKIGHVMTTRLVTKTEIFWLYHGGFIRQRYGMRSMAFGAFRYVCFLFMWNISMRRQGFAAVRFIICGFFGEFVIGTMTAEALFFFDLFLFLRVRTRVQYSKCHCQNQRKQKRRNPFQHKHLIEIEQKERICLVLL
jgi:hypothetical protein